MTTFKFDADAVVPILEINRGYVFVRRITEFRRVSKAIFEGRAQGARFTIEGGRAAGGSARDWFLDWEVLGGTLHCTSLLEAVRTIENC